MPADRKKKAVQTELFPNSPSLQRRWKLFFRESRDVSPEVHHGSLDELYKILDRRTKESGCYSAVIYKPSGRRHRIWEVHETFG